MNGSMRDFYLEAYPDDPCGQEIRPDVTFEDAWNALGEGVEFYSFMGAQDSIVRERLFDELARRKNVDYDTVYDRWLGQN